MFDRAPAAGNDALIHAALTESLTLASSSVLTLMLGRFSVERPLWPSALVHPAIGADARRDHTARPCT